MVIASSQVWARQSGIHCRQSPNQRHAYKLGDCSRHASWTITWSQTLIKNCQMVTAGLVFLQFCKTQSDLSDQSNKVVYDICLTSFQWPKCWSTSSTFARTTNWCPTGRTEASQKVTFLITNSLSFTLVLLFSFTKIIAIFKLPQCFEQLNFIFGLVRFYEKLSSKKWYWKSLQT